MRKGYKYFIAIWLIVFLLFNGVLFIVLENTTGIRNASLSFWISYSLIVVSFISQFLCARRALNGNAKTLFWGIPLLRVSLISFISSFLLGLLLILLRFIPAWCIAVICLLKIAADCIAILYAKAAGDIVISHDAAIKQKTSFINSMTFEAELLMNDAKGGVEETEYKKIYEALKYSDPVSSSQARDVEKEIKTLFDECKKGYSEATVRELLKKIKIRNNIIKSSK